MVHLSLHSSLPTYLRLDIVPFVALFIAVLTAYFLVEEQFTTYVYIALAIVAALFIGVQLACLWSAGVRVFCRYRKWKVNANIK